MFLKSLSNLFKRSNMFDNLSPTAFMEARKETPDAVVLDVRTPAEFAEGHIKGAVNADIMSPNFPHRVAALDKDKQYFVVCRSGGRSSRACSYLAQQGFQRPVNLSGGMMAWGYEGRPVA